EERLDRVEKAVQTLAATRPLKREQESDGKVVLEARASKAPAPEADAQEARAPGAHAQGAKRKAQKGAVDAGAVEKAADTTGPHGDFPWWDRLLEEMRGKKRTVEALLKEGTPRSYRPGHLVVAFAPGFRFHWENVRRPDNLRLVEEVLSRLAGEKITVECILEEEEKTQTPEKEQELVQKALKLFGGEVVKAEEEE
ncbi:MAG: hypothetical protein GX085_02105, partial [Firmicutes bacterium]|nr:hypothetical protein [Bacillota bacterium]